MLPRLLPSKFFYNDQLTYSAKRLMFRIATVAGAVGLLAVAVLLLDESITKEVIAGAFFAWGVALAVWSVSSYRKDSDDVRTSLYEEARYDVLHDRLNDLARAVGAAELDVFTDLPEVLVVKMERVAHFSGLDEFR